MSSFLLISVIDIQSDAWIQHTSEDEIELPNEEELLCWNY